MLAIAPMSWRSALGSRDPVCPHPCRKSDPGSPTSAVGQCERPSGETGRVSPCTRSRRSIGPGTIPPQEVYITHRRLGLYSVASSQERLSNTPPDATQIGRIRLSRPTLHERIQNATVALRDHLTVPAGGFDQQPSPCVQCVLYTMSGGATYAQVGYTARSRLPGPA